jgi:AraC-like DNA-binding protein/TolB-like protein/Flp pilus assembly protein TadD
MAEPSHTDQLFIRKLTDIILANLADENFGVNELAQKSGISLKSLRKRLTKITKKTVNQFIRDTRLLKAMEMLQNESYTVSEVAYRVGFASSIYFIKCFHEFFGFPPGKVKKGDLTDRELNILTRDSDEKKAAEASRRSYFFTLPRILLFAAVLGAVGFALLKRAYKPEKIEDLVSSDGRISIAVMPFQNMTNDTAWNIWQDGIQNELISNLSNHQELKLKQSEQISALLKGKGLSNYASLTPNIAGRISKKIDAGTFLFGRILKSGSSIRVDAQLTDSRTKEVYKSFQIERPSREEFVFQIIDSLSEQIKNFLITTVLGKELRPEDRPVTRSAEAYRYYAKGLKAFFKYDFSEAVLFYKLALSKDSDLTMAASDMSFAYGYLGKEDQSRIWCLWLYKRKERLPYLEKLWVEYVYACNFETPYESIKCLERLQEYDDSSPNYHYLLGAEYLSSDQFGQAVAEFRKSFDLEKKRSPELLDDWDYTGLGQAYHKAGLYKNEKRLYKRALKHFPESPELLYRQAVLSLTEKDTLAAGKYIGKYMVIMKNKAVSEADILTKLAGICSEAKIPDKAEVYYRQALALEPDDPVRINNLSYFLIDNDRNINEGLALADTALRLKPDDFNFLETKGWGLFKQGKLQQALSTLQKSWDSRMQISTYSYTAFLHLEQVKNKLGSSPN